MQAEDFVNMSDTAGSLLLLPLFIFIVKAVAVYFKIERRDGGEKLKSTKYYQLIFLQFIILFAFVMFVWQLAIAISVTAAVFVFVANKIMNKKYLKAEPDKADLTASMKIKDVLIGFAVSVSEGLVINLLIINRSL